MDTALAHRIDQRFCADKILKLQAESDVQDYVSELIRDRRLSLFVRSMNACLRDGPADDRAKAEAALRRIGFWVE